MEHQLPERLLYKMNMDHQRFDALLLLGGSNATFVSSSAFVADERAIAISISFRSVTLFRCIFVAECSSCEKTIFECGRRVFFVVHPSLVRLWVVLFSVSCVGFCSLVCV